MKKMHLENG